MSIVAICAAEVRTQSVGYYVRSIGKIGHTPLARANKTSLLFTKAKDCCIWIDELFSLLIEAVCFVISVALWTLLKQLIDSEMGWH